MCYLWFLSLAILIRYRQRTRKTESSGTVVLSQHAMKTWAKLSALIWRMSSDAAKFDSEVSLITTNTCKTWKNIKLHLSIKWMSISPWIRNDKV